MQIMWRKEKQHIKIWLEKKNKKIGCVITLFYSINYQWLWAYVMSLCVLL